MCSDVADMDEITLDMLLMERLTHQHRRSSIRTQSSSDGSSVKLSLRKSGSTASSTICLTDVIRSLPLTAASTWSWSYKQHMDTLMKDMWRRWCGEGNPKREQEDFYLSEIIRNNCARLSWPLKWVLLFGLSLCYLPAHCLTDSDGNIC